MGTFATPLKMPFFVAKTRMQAQTGSEGKYSSTLGTIQTIAREEGVAALWKGTFAACMRMSVGGSVCLATFRGISSFLGIQPE